MEILSKNYNCRNPVVAGFLPILIDDMIPCEDVIDGQSSNKSNTFIKSRKNLILITNNQKLASSFKASVSQVSTATKIPTTIYQIDVSKICIPNIYKSKLKSSCDSSNNNNSKSKKTLRNKRQKEARRKRKNQRHVHFPEQDELIAIVVVIEDDECIKEYRNKYWEFFAIDRNRFENRVRKISNILERILSPSHREKIYKERFLCEEGEKKYSTLNSTSNESSQFNGLEKVNKNEKLNLKQFNHRGINGENYFRHETKGNELECKRNASEISVSSLISHCLIIQQ